jgi:hypothetical protein
MIGVELYEYRKRPVFLIHLDTRGTFPVLPKFIKRLNKTI